MCVQHVPDGSTAMQLNWAGDVVGGTITRKLRYRTKSNARTVPSKLHTHTHTFNISIVNNNVDQQQHTSRWTPHDLSAKRHTATRALCGRWTSRNKTRSACSTASLWRRPTAKRAQLAECRTTALDAVLLRLWWWVRRPVRSRASWWRVRDLVVSTQTSPIATPTQPIDPNDPMQHYDTHTNQHCHRFCKKKWK